MNKTTMKSYGLFCDVSVNTKTKNGIGGYILLPIEYLDKLPDNLNKNEIQNMLITKQFKDTSSTTLEVLNVLWALENFKKEIQKSDNNKLIIFSDSQCVNGLMARRARLEQNNLISKRTKESLKNASLYREFYRLYDEIGFEIVKVKGHSKSGNQDTIHRIFSYVDRGVRQSLLSII
jgi:ribonuclease HI